MTRADNPEYYEHCKDVVKAVLSAENKCKQRDRIMERFKARELTAEQYIEAVVDELLSRTDATELQ